MAKYKIEIDEDKCISCGACADACDNFELQDKAKVKKSEVDDIGCNQAAVDVCPVNCIKITKVEE